MTLMEWLTLEGYAAKYGVSTSTLRRRMRADKVHKKLVRGRYMIPDDEGKLLKTLFARVIPSAISENDHRMYDIAQAAKKYVAQFPFATAEQAFVVGATSLSSFLE